MVNWFWKRVFSDRNIAYLLQKADPYIENYIVSRIKDSSLKLMEDPEFNGWLKAFLDTYYDHYTKKFWGSIGGQQKGLNYAMAEMNPLEGLLDADGNISISGIVRAVASGRFKGFLSQTPSPPQDPSRASMPKM